VAVERRLPADCPAHLMMAAFYLTEVAPRPYRRIRLGFAPLNLITVRTGTWEFERQTELNIGLDSEAFGRRVLGGRTH